MKVLVDNGANADILNDEELQEHLAKRIGSNPEEIIKYKEEITDNIEIYKRRFPDHVAENVASITSSSQPAVSSDVSNDPQAPNDYWRNRIKGDDAKKISEVEWKEEDRSDTRCR